jgi:signal transduction histidine kinase/iron only hydrogenase large subunit-like protein
MAVVGTIEEKCKRCYTCVRNCPVKAIRVKNEQAKVIRELCISCGTCVRVCNQNAKQIEDGIEQTLLFLRSTYPVAAILAPSFVAAFPECTPGELVGALKELGFGKVCEVAYGAELVAGEYAKYMPEAKDGFISTPCPAVVDLVEIHYPSLIPLLAPIVSPMVALGRYLKQRDGKNLRVVFIGPCVAKKEELRHPSVADAVDAVLTYREFREILARKNIGLKGQVPLEFDPPHPGLGRSFPLHGGLLRTAAVDSDILAKDILTISGIEDTLDFFGSLSKGYFTGKFVDILFCKGCINGPVMETDIGPIRRRDFVVDYVEEVARKGYELPENASGVNLRRGFINRKANLPLPDEAEIRKILAQTNKYKPEDELNCGVCGYHTCRDMAIAVYQGLAEPQMCLHHLLSELEITLEELKESHERVKSTQNQLLQSEKLASLGQLSAGIAHELNNPLGGILLYANLLQEEVEGDDSRAGEVAIIVKEAARCREIVKNLLNFARQTRIHPEETDMEELLGEVVSICSREVESQSKQIELVLELAGEDRHCSVDAAQLKQALLNIVFNAIESIPRGGTITLRGAVSASELKIEVKDTGCGIPEANLAKVFDPFFTTKAIGKGTGLGLATVHGIIKMHRGNIDVKSAPGQGTRVIVSLPCSAT